MDQKYSLSDEIEINKQAVEVRFEEASLEYEFNKEVKESQTSKNKIRGDATIGIAFVFPHAVKRGDVITIYPNDYLSCKGQIIYLPELNILK